MPRHALLATTLIVAGLSVGCASGPATSIALAGTEEPAPTARPRPSAAIGDAASALLATLPMVAGGIQLDGTQVVTDALNVGHPVDDVLGVLGKRRPDAASVFRWSGSVPVTIGAMTVDGVDGDALLKAFADTWDAPAVVEKHTRVLGGTIAWQLADRGGTWTLIYRKGDAVYVVAAPDQATLEAVLADMPPPIAGG